MKIVLAILLAQQNMSAPAVDDPSLAPGSTVSFDIVCAHTNPDNLIAADFYLNFDPAVLEFSGAVPGNFFSSPFIANNWLAEPGKYWLSALSLGSPTPPGSYTVVTVTFNVLSRGTSALTLDGGAYPPVYLDGTGAAVFADPVVHGSFTNLRTDVAVTGLVAPGAATVGDVVTLSADVANVGDLPFSCEVEFVVGTTVVGTVAVTALAPGGTANVWIAWDTAGWPAGGHGVAARVAALPGETEVSDNAQYSTIVLSDPSPVGGGAGAASSHGEYPSRTKCGASAPGGGAAVWALLALAACVAYLLK